MIVVLLGYMGSGKSTIGRLLAKKLEFKFLDLDEYIEQNEKVSVAELFNSKGEIYFRSIEAKAVKQLCNDSDSLVLALGGGTPCFGDTMSFLNEHSNVMTFYLKASVSELTKRLVNEKSSRPLIAHLDEEAIPEFIAKHLFERSFYYNQSKVNINTDDQSVEAIVELTRSKLV
ncbi:shikimate kinase [bacterium]|nr:shikimate kinase [Flavobacteriaceae bacterium]MDB4206636.1 shikimate kinase [Flavobacteriaceae bacterium]MDC0117788.1 shikimate kinase [bacterium]